MHRVSRAARSSPSHDAAMVHWMVIVCGLCWRLVMPLHWLLRLHLTERLLWNAAWGCPWW